MTRVRGPKDGQVLNTLFNGSGRKHHADLKQTKALILLSIAGNEYCSGDYLRAIVQDSCKQFGSVTFLIADEVYWNNLKSTGDLSIPDSETLKQRALELGDQFITDNLNAFLSPLSLNKEQLDIQGSGSSADEQIAFINESSKEKGFNFEIIRWQDWVNNSSHHYARIQKEIEAVYDTTPELSQSINDTASDFARRHKQDGDETLWRERSRSYLKEESPAVMWLAAYLDYEFVCYPGSMIKPFLTTHHFFIRQQPSESLSVSPFEIIASVGSRANWLDIHFERSRLKPNCAILPKEPSQQTISSASCAFFSNSSSSPLSTSPDSVTEAFLHKLTEQIYTNHNTTNDEKLEELISRLNELKNTRCNDKKSTLNI
jgi:hypothetical protein